MPGINAVCPERTKILSILRGQLPSTTFHFSIYSISSCLVKLAINKTIKCVCWSEFNAESYRIAIIHKIITTWLMIVYSVLWKSVWWKESEKSPIYNVLWARVLKSLAPSLLWGITKLHSLTIRVALFIYHCNGKCTNCKVLHVKLFGGFVSARVISHDKEAVRAQGPETLFYEM